MPYARFKEVNDSLKSAKEFRDKHGWVEQFQTDPLPYLEQWLDQLSGHPEMGPKLAAKAARMLQSRRGAAAPQASEEPQPNIPIQDAQGNVVGYTFDAKQQKAWQEWNWQQREAALNDRLKPLEDMRQDAVQRQEMQQLHETSMRETHATLSELRANPVFAEHEPKIKAALIEHPEWGADVQRAFVHVLTTQVLPTLSDTTSRKVLDSLANKAGGATVNPGGASASQMPKFKSHKDALVYFDAHPDEAEKWASR